MDEVREIDRRRTRPALLIVGAAAVLLLLGLALYWFAPQTLLVNREVADDLPDTRPVADADAAPATQATAAPIELARGRFRALSHPGDGDALLLELADGSGLVRFEGLATDNGPDLRVYLSAAEADGPADAHDEDFVDLGPLKGNRGDQNYAIPVGVDASRYRSVVIWCRRFSVGFTVAPLET